MKYIDNLFMMKFFSNAKKIDDKIIKTKNLYFASNELKKSLNNPIKNNKIKYLR